MYKNNIGYIFLLVIMMIIYVVGIRYLVSSNNLLSTPSENLNHVKILALPLKMLLQPKLATSNNLNVKEVI